MPTHATSKRVPRVLIVATGAAASQASGRALAMKPVTARIPHPDDGLIAFYAVRLEAGMTGVLIEMAQA